MPGGQVYWTLVFTAANLEHLAERNVEAADVTNAVYGEHGAARVRRSGSGARRRAFVVAPLEDGDVFRAALPRDLKAEGAFVISAARVPEPPGEFDSSMRLCVSARMADSDEIRSYRRWRGTKGNR